MVRLTGWQLLVVSLIVLTNLAPAPTVPASDWVKARVNGKYKGFLRQIKAPEDRGADSGFQDVGWREVAEWKGHKDLPPAYWVYVDPYWYLWRDVASVVGPKPPYHPDQAAGPPDTLTAGDQGTAWAAATPDQQVEWLELEYAEPVIPAALKVYETCSPGAINKVSVFALDGTEDVVWSGRDPTPPHRPMGVSVLPIRGAYPTARVRIQLNSPGFPGWNEIDAVGLIDAGGRTQWAAAARASTTFGQQNGPAAGARGGPLIQGAQGFAATVPAMPGATPAAAPQPPLAQNLARLEAEVRQTRKQCDELKTLLEASQGEIKALKTELEALKRKSSQAAP
jgi:hypothetical protein